MKIRKSQQPPFSGDDGRDYGPKGPGAPFDRDDDHGRKPVGDDGRGGPGTGGYGYPNDADKGFPDVDGRSSRPDSGWFF